ncbi:MAG: LPS export ABC transporter periplasmic protein LptC [Candidatus Omnitrophota bacterium]
MFKKIFHTTIMVSMIAVPTYFFMQGYSGKEAVDKTVVLTEDEELENENTLEQKLMSFTIEGGSPKGARQWHLEAVSADIVGEQIHLETLKVISYSENSTSTLTSDKGIYHRDKGEIELIGNVKAVSEDGAILTTDYAKWKHSTKDIDTDSFVQINHRSMTAVGEGARANSEKRTAVLKKDVEVMIEPNTKIECDGSLNVNYEENTAVFHENVRIDDNEGELFADKLTAYFDPEKKCLDRAVAEGNVKIQKGESFSISEKAVYTGSTKSAKLLGRPRIILDPQQLSEMDGVGDNVEGGI